MILSYLSIRDIISVQFDSQRFKEISETPSLWKKFVWPDYEPHQHVDPLHHVDLIGMVVGVYFDKMLRTCIYIL